jgi:hypothetical protein
VNDVRWTRATCALFSGAAVLVFAVFRDYGITWDEHFHDTYGKAALKHYLSGFADTEALTYFNLWLYGAAFDVVSAAAKRVLPFAEYESQHLAIAFAGLAGAAAAARMGQLAGGARAGFLAGLTLLAIPSWWGHMFINPKDIPFAAAMAWTLYWSMRAARELPRPEIRTVIWLGISLGLSLGIRIVGLYALVYPAFAVTFWMVVHARQSRSGIGQAFVRICCAFLGACAIAYTVMLAFWPWALRDPLHRPAEALAVFAATPWDINVLFDGRLVSSMGLPASYLPVYLGVKLPLFVLAAAAVAAVCATRALVRRGRGALRPETALLGFAALFPVALFLVARPVSYDAIRHFLFVLPPVAAVAAMGIDRLVTWTMQAAAPVRAAAMAAIAGIGVLHAAELRAIHPYQYVYYNQLTHGTGGADGRFELDYWGSAYREAALRLDAFVASESPDHVQTVFVCAEGSSAAPYLSRDLELSADDRSADFYLSTTRLGCDREYEGKTILTVARAGATLAVVKDRRALKREGTDRLDAHPVAGALVAPRHPGLQRDGRPQADLD